MPISARLSAIPCLLFYITVLILEKHQSFSFQLIDPKEEYTKHLVSFTNIPRISYKITKDETNSFWIVNLPVKQQTNILPMLLLPYSSTTWISSQTYSSINIEGVVCDSATACIPITQSSGNDVVNGTFLNYTLPGITGFIQAYPYSDTTLFSIEIVDKQMPPLNPSLSIAGGLGLAMDDESDDDTDSDDISIISFLESFYNLDHYMASIFLSTDNFDVTSELLIGDFNTAYIKRGGYNATIPSSSYWSILVQSITDENGTTYYYASDQSNLTNEIIFDPNYNSIGIPPGIYPQILQPFIGIGCSNSSILPTCNCSDVSVFPTLYFDFGNNNTVVFPSDLYLDQENNCTLLISSTNQTNLTSEYANNWIFGYPVMTYYYTVLDWTNSQYQVSLYQTDTFQENLGFYIIVGAILAVVIIGGLLACANIIFDRKSSKPEPWASYVEFTEQKQQTETNKEENQDLNS